MAGKVRNGGLREVFKTVWPGARTRSDPCPAPHEKPRPACFRRLSAGDGAVGVRSSHGLGGRAAQDRGSGDAGGGPGDEGGGSSDSGSGAGHEGSRSCDSGGGPGDEGGGSSDSDSGAGHEGGGSCDSGSGAGDEGGGSGGLEGGRSGDAG